MIFAVRQLHMKGQEMRTHLSSTFVDLTKAFYTVNHEGLWKSCSNLTVHERLTQMVCMLHDGMMARVTESEAVSETFTVTNQRMPFQSRVSTTAVRILLFFDDHVLNATSEGDRQRSMYLFAASCDNFGLVTNTEKTVVMHQPPPDVAPISTTTPN
nr:unnamed protein product [Spirometra erinaceieuropaei]